MLVDHDIESALTEGSIGITPYNPAHLNPASVDLTLSPLYRKPIWGKRKLMELDLGDLKPNHTLMEEAPSDGKITLFPGEQMLASTNETIYVGGSHAARVEGKSSLGRVFLAVHITAGFIDPGFCGHITLEIVNMSPWTILLPVDMRIAQICFIPTSSNPVKDYSVRGSYHQQVGPTESRYKP